MVHKWEPGDLASTLFTDAELLKLHRYFGLPSVEKLSNVLERARPDEMDVSVRKVLQEIVAHCQTCIEHSSPRRRFKVTLGMDEAHVNLIVALDVMSLESRNVLHIADEATQFQAAAFLQSNTAEEVWRVFVRLWIRTYLGPPDFIRADQGNNLTAEWFVSSAIAEGIEVLEAPTECPATMSPVERYHAPLRTAYQKIRSDFGFEPEEVLELAVKCVNDTVGPESLTPTLLVFGSIPRPVRKVPADSQIKRVRAMDAARKAVTAEHARQKISFAQRYIGPYGNERDDLKALEL
jgi:hypothetical protein